MYTHLLMKNHWSFWITSRSKIYLSIKVPLFKSMQEWLSQKCHPERKTARGNMHVSIVAKKTTGNPSTYDEALKLLDNIKVKNNSKYQGTIIQERAGVAFAETPSGKKNRKGEHMCFHCCKEDHWQSDCPELTKEQKEKSWSPGSIRDILTEDSVMQVKKMMMVVWRIWVFYRNNK